MLNKALKKNKRGEGFVAWFFVIIVILAFSVFMLVLNKAWDDIETPLGEELDENLPDDAPFNASSILSDVGNTNRNFSNMLPFLVIGLFSFVLISAGALMKHPIMIIIGIIVLGVCILIAVVFSNVYTEMSTDSEFSSTQDGLAIQGKFMDYLPYIIVIMAVGIFIALIFGRSKGGGGSMP